MKRTVPVSRRALIQRINRVLKSDDEVLKATRGELARSNLGDYYILDLPRNAVVHRDVDIEALGRKLNVLREFESLGEDS